MKNTMELNNFDRERYTQSQKIDTAIGVCFLLAILIALAY